jgi:hypothetical protein
VGSPFVVTSAAVVAAGVAEVVMVTAGVLMVSTVVGTVVTGDALM